MPVGTRVPMMKDWTLGKRLTEARTLAGLNQVEMADELGKRGVQARHASVNKYEHDQSQPRDLLGLVKAWAEITDVRMDWILLGEDVGQDPAESMPELPFREFADAA